MAPKYLSVSLGELSAVPHPSIPPPRSRTLFPSRGPAALTLAAQPRPLLHLPGEGEEKGGGERGRYVPSRHQGVRREARTGSLQEQGTYRLDPSNVTQNKKPPTVK